MTDLSLAVKVHTLYIQTLQPNVPSKIKILPKFTYQYKNSWILFWFCPSIDLAACVSDPNKNKSFHNEYRPVAMVLEQNKPF